MINRIKTVNVTQIKADENILYKYKYKYVSEVTQAVVKKPMSKTMISFRFIKPQSTCNI